VLQPRPQTLLIEDDHASFLCASTPCACVHSAEAIGKKDVSRAKQRDGEKGRRGERERERRGRLFSPSPHLPLSPSVSLPRWAHIRSLSKSFNPDLRLAVMTGDDQTMNAVLDRIIVAERWVSHMLQATAYALLSDKTIRAQVRDAGRAYDERRDTLIALLEDAGFQPSSHWGRSGYNIWLPVTEETPTVQGLAVAAGGGFAVAAGERFRLASPPGIRITASRLEAKDAQRFVNAIVDVVPRSSRSSSV
jgi:DNA-binding transcriptional MocR family regulator